MIQIKNLELSFNSLSVLKNVSLQVNKGEVVSIVGPSGSGKSTLLRCLNLLDRPDSGQILLENENILTKNYNTQYLRKRVGMIFQHFNLFPHMKVLRNVSFAVEKVLGKTRSEADESAAQILENVGLKEHMNKHPRQLSGGQKQRVAIARALAMSPHVLLLDEPTSALDPEMVKEVLDVISKLKQQGITMLVVSHEMSFARKVADRLIFMDDGSVVEDTTPDKFYTKPETKRGQAFLEKIMY